MDDCDESVDHALGGTVFTRVRASSARSGSHRPVIAALLSEESYDALMDYVAENRTTVAALLESIGRVLASPSGEDDRNARIGWRPSWRTLVGLRSSVGDGANEGATPRGVRAPSGRCPFVPEPPVGNARVPGDVREGVLVLSQLGQVWTRTAERLARDTKERGRPPRSPTATGHTGWPG
jgi:hypothetical protein